MRSVSKNRSLIIDDAAYEMTSSGSTEVYVISKRSILGFSDVCIVYIHNQFGILPMGRKGRGIVRTGQIKDIAEVLSNLGLPSAI